jgi:hypothetical protein
MGQEPPQAGATIQAPEAVARGPLLGGTPTLSRDIVPMFNRGVPFFAQEHNLKVSSL